MEITQLTTIISGLLDLGAAGVLLVLFWFYRKDNNNQRVDRDAEIKEAREELRTLHEKMLTVIDANTTGATELRAVVRANTETIQSLPEKFDYILRQHK